MKGRVVVMILGIDIDGCLNDSERWEKESLIEFSKKNQIKLPEDYLLIKHFGLDDDIYQTYMNEYFPRMVRENPPRLYTKEVLYALKRLGHTLKIITARDALRDKDDEPYKGYMMKRDTLNWFDQNGIPYDNITFSSTTGDFTKGTVCKEEEIDIMLDDDIKNIEEIVNAGIPCIIMKNINNQYCDLPNTYLVDNMTGYYNTVIKLSKL